MTQKTRERLALHFKKLGVDNPYAADLKDEQIVETPKEEEKEEVDYFKKKSGRKQK